jgi:quercetin dioxygenase-like cupin family protein
MSRLTEPARRTLSWLSLLPAAVISALLITSAAAVEPSDLNPAAIRITLPNQIHWVDSGGGAEQAVMAGDPNKPGLYVVLVKWTPHHMSHPHFHPHERYITVLSGTWWVGTGRKFDPNRTVPLPAGSFVVHHGGQIHYDGAKETAAVLEIVGEGPATATPAEQ